MASRIDWARLKTSTIALELVQLVLALAAIALGWLNFPLLVLLLMVELVLIAGISAAFYPERSLRQHAGDTLRMLFLCGFCSIFLIASYAGAKGFQNGLVLEPQGFAVLVALIATRLIMVAISAWSSNQRRLIWAREVLLRGGVQVVTMFFAVFACFIPGLFVAGLLAPYWPEISADLGLGSVLLLIQAGLACVMSTMTDKELAEISNRPYIK